MLLFVRNLRQSINKNTNVVVSEGKLPVQFQSSNDSYLVTQKGNDFPFSCQQGLVVALTEVNLIAAINYFYKKATLEIIQFQNVKDYKNI